MKEAIGDLRTVRLKTKAMIEGFHLFGTTIKQRDWRGVITKETFSKTFILFFPCCRPLGHGA